MDALDYKRARKIVAPLSEEEVKTLKRERIWGYIFATFVVAGTALGLGVVCLVVLDLANTTILSVATLALLVALGGCYLINRKVMLDIKEQEVIKIEAVVEDKFVKTSREGGMTELPMLEKLNSRFFATQIQQLDSLIFIVKGLELEVDKKAYFSIEKGDKVNLLYSKRLNLFLRIEKIREENL